LAKAETRQNENVEGDEQQCTPTPYHAFGPLNQPYADTSTAFREVIAIPTLFRRDSIYTASNMNLQPPTMLPNTNLIPFNTNYAKPLRPTGSGEYKNRRTSSNAQSQLENAIEPPQYPQLNAKKPDDESGRHSDTPTNAKGTINDSTGWIYQRHGHHRFRTQRLSPL
jgi:hypothetical protein